MANQTDVSFGIGAVSRLTGVPIDTLRIWERRYGAVTPSRTPRNRRRYSRDDVSRLLLIKQLVDQGEPVGTIVRLPEAELNQKLMAHAELQDRAAALEPALIRPSAHPSVLIYGEVLAHQICQWSAQLPSLEIIGGYDRYEDFERDCVNRQPDIVILEFPALQDHTVNRIMELLHMAGGPRLIVVYAFTASSVLERLKQSGIQTLRSPVTPAMLARACESTIGKSAPPVDSPAMGTAPLPKRFGGRDLAEIANLETRLVCECPHHLADLVIRVGAFEQYSLDCEVRNRRDAVLHARLHQMTAQARAMLEQALSFLLESENIRLSHTDHSQHGMVAEEVDGAVMRSRSAGCAT